MSENRTVIEGLIAKRAEVSGKVSKARLHLERLTADLQAMDWALDLMGYSEDANDIPRKTRGGRIEKEAAEAMRDYLRRLLAESPSPMRAALIARAYRQDHGITATPPPTEGRRNTTATRC